jgi:hypothetical protein
MRKILAFLHRYGFPAGLLGIAVLVGLYRVSAGVAGVHAATVVMLTVLMCLGCVDLLLAVLSMVLQTLKPGDDSVSTRL